MFLKYCASFLYLTSIPNISFPYIDVVNELKHDCETLD